ncbi:hypothetical protein H6G41_04345 [Tolypothrix sp. FACHB-123]|uniref:hypothetical protein n=1 Tax=Tolypothrix sp. FACHB-123 TaxID=2692868 RepID=UPI0016873AD1|nr:hypothetical protein [Tolypothrix sp. FACHB-123]MBD2353858.1 hypothetical protein [Tolypothrix sp. FACHB-123]
MRSLFGSFKECDRILVFGKCDRLCDVGKVRLPFGFWRIAISFVKFMGKCDRILVVLRNAIAFIKFMGKCDRLLVVVERVRCLTTSLTATPL